MDIETTDKTWDLIVIGGGITGAGVLREAVRMGLKTLLVEKHDYAWGTSSRSSKLVHGGLRYLKQGRIHLTYESVRQRQRLLNEAPGLVEEIDFLMPIYKTRGPGRLSITAGLMLYNAMAGKRYHSYHAQSAFQEMVPGIETRGLIGGFRFMDAQTDDARLVLRLINESVTNGGTALNYTTVTRIIRDGNNNVCGIAANDTETGQSVAFPHRPSSMPRAHGPNPCTRFTTADCTSAPFGAATLSFLQHGFPFPGPLPLSIRMTGGRCLSFHGKMRLFWGPRTSITARTQTRKLPQPMKKHAT